MFESDSGAGAKKKVFVFKPSTPGWRLPIWAIIAQTPPNGYAAISVSANSLI
jgi:hypothetical protein